MSRITITPRSFSFSSVTNRVGNDGVPGEPADLFGSLRDRRVRSKDGERRLHQTPDGVFRVRFVAHPLPAGLQRSRRQDGLLPVVGQAFENVDRHRGIQQLEHIDHEGLGITVKELDRFTRRAGYERAEKPLQLRRQFLGLGRTRFGIGWCVHGPKIQTITSRETIR